MTDPRPNRATRLTLWTLAALILTAIAATVSSTGDLMASIPRHDAELDRLISYLQARGATRLLAIEAWPDPASANPASMADVHDALVALGPALQGTGAAPLPQPGPNEILHMATVIEDHLPVLLDQADLDEAAKRMDPEHLRGLLQSIKDRASRPDDQFVSLAAGQDVLALGAFPLAALPKNLMGMSVSDGVVTNPDGVHQLFPLSVDFDPGDMPKTAPLMAKLRIAVADAAAHGIRMEPIGAYRHFDDNLSSLSGDFLTTIPLGIALILLVLWSLARSLPAVLAMGVPAALGLAGAVAAVHISGQKLPLPLVGFAASLLGVAVDYGIQMTVALRAGAPARVLPPLGRSALISVAAFAALVTSPVPALAILGLMVVGGLVVAYAAARWLLPDVVAVRPVGDPWARFSVPLLTTIESRPLMALGLGAVITLALAPGIARTKFVDDLMRMDGSRPETRAALGDFLTRWGSLEPSTFVVGEAPDADTALRDAANARKTLGLPPSALERFLPDRAEQARRLTAWNSFWTAHLRFYQDLNDACAAVGLRSTAFTMSCLRYSPRKVAELIPSAMGTVPPMIPDIIPREPDANARHPMTLAAMTPLKPDDWQGTPLATFFSTLLTRDHDHWLASSPVDLPQGPQYALDLYDRANAADIKPAWIATRAAMARRLVLVLRSDLAQRGLLIALAVVLAVAVATIGTALARLRTARKTPPLTIARTALAMLVPPAIALTWTFGLLGWCGIELTPFSVLVAAFVGGIGIDCAVFLAQREDRAALLSPVIACILTAIAGTGAMLFAKHPLLAGVGLTLTIGMVSCLVASVLLTPALAGRGDASD
jgi:predicted exporter